MAASLEQGMRYRFAFAGAIVEATFDGHNDGPGDSNQYLRWANVSLLTLATSTPASQCQHVPRADTHNTPVT